MTWSRTIGTTTVRTRTAYKPRLSTVGTITPGTACTITPGTPVVKLSVPFGKYAIFAKINIDQDDTTHRATVACTLNASNDLDRNVIALDRSGEKFLDNVAMPFQAVEEVPTFAAPVPPDIPLWDIHLSCRITEGESSLLSFRFAKIMAIKLDGTLCEKESPAVCP